MKAKVKFFNSEKGFGKLNNGKDDIFFHINVAKKFGLSVEDFILDREFEIEIEPSNKGGYQVKNFIVTKPKKKILPANINFSLFLNKPHHKEIKNIVGDEIKLEPRKKELEEFDFSSIDLNLLKQRSLNNAKTLVQNVNDICLKPDWRLVLGIGGASVYETSITLHHIYGIPYIPASSIKGTIRNYIIQEAFDSKEEKAIENKEFCDIFGCSKEHEIQLPKSKKKKKHPSFYGLRFPKEGDREGKITFFDAFPIDKINISLDIMNVHYKEYYNSEKEENGTYKKGSVKPPADWDSPNIINFLTVQNTHFQFIIGSLDNSSNSLKIQDKTIFDWLKEALTEHGIGAKTSVGYGYFQ